MVFRCYELFSRCEIKIDHMNANLIEFIVIFCTLPDPVNKEQGYCHIWFSLFDFHILTFLDF